MTIPMPEPVILRTVMPDDYRYGHVYGFTRRQMEAYADARVRKAHQWHPIETAPKDGTWILAINAAKNPGRQHVVHYSERWGNHYPWVTGSAPMDFVAGVTHWMPLPAPPPPGPVEPTTN